MSNYEQQYGQIFEYLSAPDEPTEALPTIVFGRHDPIVAHRAGELVMADLADIIVITGGIGKDTGAIRKQGFRTEADYLDYQLRQHAAEHDYELPNVILERKAKTGHQNGRFATRELQTHGSSLERLTATAHAVSSLRLAETLQHEVEQQTGTRPKIYRTPSRLAFEPANPKMQTEAGLELLRLDEWPADGMLGPRRDDIPDNLVDFARERHGHAPKQPSDLMLRAISLLPASVQIKLMRRKAKAGSSNNRN